MMSNIILALIMLSLQKWQLGVEAVFNKQQVYTATFHVQWFNASPDGYERQILSINNQFPSPTIIVNRGDVINITVVNQASEAISIHWHGITQRHSLHMDGVPGVTQCAILPTQSYVYQFNTNEQSGTYWYHSHSGIQYGDGLKGVLIINDPNDPWKNYYTNEEVLQLSDWYHTPVGVLLQAYVTSSMEDPIPDTGLINGIGQFNCKICEYYNASIQTGETKRYRIINTSIYAAFTLTIDEHKMRVIEADGTILNGDMCVRSLRINPGQRYSVLVNGKRNPTRNYWIRATINPFRMFNEKFNTSVQPNVSAILQYTNNNGEYIFAQSPPMTTFNNVDGIILESITSGMRSMDESNLHPLKSNTNRIPNNNKNTKTIVLNVKVLGSSPGYFALNNSTFSHSLNTTLLYLLLSDSENQLLSDKNIGLIETNEIIDVVINNIDYAPHPFHLHGHFAWILASGKTNEGFYNETMHRNIKYNLHNPIYRDTWTVNPNTYIVFRFKANNPGIWMMHCHNDWHLQLGMAFVFLESPQNIKRYYKGQMSSIPSHCMH
ncbi:unnamed protein product [Didymodactylos carnosus]|uniref:Multicopper oxidase n=1 Tax=Didymodactylos carnosus TaxID=1234261 RepID=A0A8S2HEZ3_9BILA|nr:unnamed protein product [Didymodactylos carnosus]CAF3634549.1 unnamed protein product [Didymodactylos carnosus]